MFLSLIKMYGVATTRFNNETYLENVNWRIKNNWDGCIYGVPMKIRDVFGEGCPLFIIEMNNDENLIEGIGIINNSVCTDKYYRIYKDGNYNRYTYKSKFRIDRDDFLEEDYKIVEKIEDILFKGKGHCKRGQGISSIPKNQNILSVCNKIFKKWVKKKYS